MGKRGKTDRQIVNRELLQQKRERANINRIEKENEKMFNRKNMNALSDQYSRELRGVKEKFFYNVGSLTNEQFRKLQFRFENLNIFNDLTEKYISSNFSNLYKTKFGLPANYSASDLFDFNPCNRDTQKFNFNYDDIFYNKLISSQKAKLFPTEIITNSKCDKIMEHKITHYLTEVDGQVVLLLNVVSKTNANDNYFKDSSSSYKMFAFIQGSEEGCINLMRCDYAPTGPHPNAFNEFGKLENKLHTVFKTHIHLQNKRFNLIFPAKVNSTDVVALDKDYNNFPELVGFLDKKLKIDNINKTIFTSKERAENTSFQTAYYKFINENEEFKVNMPPHLMPVDLYFNYNKKVKTENEEKEVER